MSISNLGNCAVYNHAISSLTISELYGTTKSVHAARIEAAIKKSLAATLEMQRWPKDRPNDKGGWRYLKDYDATDSDLSITGWQLKFLRSARNAGFDVPEQPINDAVAYVRRCYDKKYRRVCLFGRQRRLTQSWNRRSRNSRARTCRFP